MDIPPTLRIDIEHLKYVEGEFPQNKGTKLVPGA